MAEYDELRQAVIEEERSHPTVARQFRDIDHNHQPEKKTSHQYRNALMAAKRLSTSLQDIPDVPYDLSQAVEQLVGFLEEAGDAERGRGTSKTLDQYTLKAKAATNQRGSLFIIRGCVSEGFRVPGTAFRVPPFKSFEDLNGNRKRSENQSQNNRPTHTERDVKHKHSRLEHRYKDRHAGTAVTGPPTSIATPAPLASGITCPGSGR